MEPSILVSRVSTFFSQFLKAIDIKHEQSSTYYTSVCNFKADGVDVVLQMYGLTGGERKYLSSLFNMNWIKYVIKLHRYYLIILSVKLGKLP